MLNRRHVLTITGFTLTTLLLFQFQNCAPAGPSTSAAASDGSVRLVDNLSQTQLAFVSPETEVQDEVQATDISGLCTSDHEGAKLTWAISADDQGGNILLSGSAVCHDGQFALDVQRLDALVCGVDHLVTVTGDWGGSASARVSRRCQPLASQMIAAPADSPPGTSCALEYTPDTEAGDSCLQVCYRDNKVVYSAGAEAGACADLAAGLAGR